MDAVELSQSRFLEVDLAVQKLLGFVGLQVGIDLKTNKEQDEMIKRKVSLVEVSAWNGPGLDLWSSSWSSSPS